MGVVRAIYVPLTLFGGGAAASTARILEHEATFRFAMVTDLATAVLTLFLVLALYRLLAPVDRALATVMALLGLMVIPLHFVNVLNDFAALLLMRGGSALSAIAQVERDALAGFFTRLHEQGVAIDAARAAPPRCWRGSRPGRRTRPPGWAATEGAETPTPRNVTGRDERINVGAFLLWVAVLAVSLPARRVTTGRTRNGRTSLEPAGRVS